MKIHILSNSPKINTGFGIVGRNLAIGLKKLGHYVTITGIQTTYVPEYYDDIKVLPLVSEIPEDAQFMVNVMSVDPDVIIYVGGMYSSEDPISLTKMFPNQFCDAKVWTYCPVEGSNIPKTMVADLNYIANNGGRVIAQCVYGHNEMKRCGVNTSGFIYHGYDPKVFKKIDLKNIPDNIKNETISFLKFCETVSEGNKNWARFDIPIMELKKEFAGKFVFLFQGANHALRKRIERLLKAYSILIGQSQQLQDGTRLHLHTSPVSATGINLLEIAEELGIRDNISFSFGKEISSGWSDNALNVLYNMVDCNVSASSSEGFGLNHLQTMAVGLPQIVPDCTSMTELIGDGMKDLDKGRGFLALIGSNFMLQDGSYRSLVNENHFAMLMKKIYTDKELITKLGSNAEKWAKQYTWDNVCLTWDKALRDMQKAESKSE